MTDIFEMSFKTLPKILFLLLLLLASSASLLWAEEDPALSEYRKNYYSYRGSLEEFKLAREEYLKWKTLASRDEAVEKSQKLLSNVSDVSSSYFSLLKKRIEFQPGFDPSVKEISLSLLNDRLDFLFRFKSEVSDIENQRELEEKSLVLLEDYERGEGRADFVKATLELAQLAEITSEVENLSLEVREMVSEDESYPQRERILGDWVFKIGGKLELSRNSQNELWERLAAFPTTKEDYEQKKLLEDVSEGLDAAQGLAFEVIEHLLEIVRKSRYD